MITQDQIRELQELLAKGTPGRKKASSDGCGASIDREGQDPPWLTFYDEEAWEDASCVAALCNAAPDLLDAAEEAIRLREALRRQHNWHLEQTERTPVYFGDTIGQVNSEEYQDSELYEVTAKALKGGDAQCLPMSPMALGSPPQTSNPDAEAIRLRELVKVMQEALDKIAACHVYYVGEVYMRDTARAALALASKEVAS